MDNETNKLTLRHTNEAVSVRTAELQALVRLNEESIRFGLSLTIERAQRLQERRDAALLENRRVEFGTSVLPALIETFLDDSRIEQADYADTLEALVAVFYRVKTEARERLTDEDVLALLRYAYDATEGDLHFLGVADVEELQTWAEKDGGNRKAF